MNNSVLIVEESDAIRGSLRDWLETMFPDLHVAEAASGEEAIALARVQSPCVVLVDVDTFRVNGIEITRQIRTILPAAKIIALTTDRSKPYYDDVTSAGANAYVNMWRIRTELQPILKALLAPESEEKKTVVCIEDEPDMIDLIRIILSRNGFELIGALGGREGLHIVRQVRPDLVLLDLMMPGMDGRQVYQQMKADDALRNIPIVVVTVMEQNSDKMRDLQVHDYVRKPFLPQELVQSVSRGLGLVA